MTRGVRTSLVVAVALVAATVASLAVHRALQRAPLQKAETPSLTVVVAAKALPPGALVGTADVKAVAWPAHSPVRGALSQPAAAVGRGLLAPVGENEPVTEGKLAPREAGAGIAPIIPRGMRAISVKVDDVVAVAGFVGPGSRVDVLVTVPEQSGSRTRTVVSNVEVMASGTRTEQETTGGKPASNTVVTLLVTPQDAERIALASYGGRVVLALRNPLDAAPTATSGVRLASLTGTTDPAPAERPAPPRKAVRAAPPPPPAPPAALYTVETIRAAKRTEEVVR
ncbi:MAG: Flp pilus assembly protein CpaB [Acidobacteria bacterium]|nr:Flp pilus assembly protein CpaB [Acidobacteriota bacterium]